MSTRKIFTMREAMDLLPRVQELTKAAVERANKLTEQMQAAEPHFDELEVRYHGVIRDWAESITRLGPEVKGLWLVDFDSGDGIYYCWRHPEPTLEYFHDYDGGFSGRRPLGGLKVT